MDSLYFEMHEFSILMQVHHMYMSCTWALGGRMQSSSLYIASDACQRFQRATEQLKKTQGTQVDNSMQMQAMRQQQKQVMDVEICDQTRRSLKLSNKLPDSQRELKG